LARSHSVKRKEKGRKKKKVDSKIREEEEFLRPTLTIGG